MLRQLHEGVLEEVVGDVAPAGEAQEERVDAGAERGERTFERAGVSRPQADDQRVHVNENVPPAGL